MFRTIVLIEDTKIVQLFCVREVAPFILQKIIKSTTLLNVSASKVHARNASTIPNDSFKDQGKERTYFARFMNNV